jgi:hypothetical protein
MKVWFEFDKVEVVDTKHKGNITLTCYECYNEPHEKYTGKRYTRLIVMRDGIPIGGVFGFYEHGEMLEQFSDMAEDYFMKNKPKFWEK